MGTTATPAAPTRRARLSEAARAMGDPRTAGAVDVDNPAEIPEPAPPRDWRAEIERSFPPGSDVAAKWEQSIVAQVLLALGEDLDSVKAPAAHLRHGHIGIKADQSDLAATVARRTQTLRRELSDLAQKVTEQEVTIERLTARLAVLEAAREKAEARR